MILCCGEALIDMIPAPTTGGAHGFVPHPGGAALNTAIALGRLGTAAGLLTGLSTDMFGTQLAQTLTASGVDISLAPRSDRPTTLAFVRLTDGRATYSFYDENSAGRMLTPNALPALPETVTTLLFGGISLACEPAADAYADLLARQSASRVVMLDPNIRPAFIERPDAYRARLDAMLARADIIKVSDEDLAWITPQARSVEDSIAILQDKGAAVVIVTLGEAGAIGALQDGTQVRVPAARTAVVDTVGAGDAFNAGFLSNLSAAGLSRKAAVAGLSRQALRAAMEHGARVAGLSVAQAGAALPPAPQV